MQTIKVNQHWIGKELINGQVFRRIRILAPHPDGGWIVKDLPTSGRFDHLELKVIKEFALNAVMKLEYDVCEHRHTSDAYIETGGYPPQTPNYYVCDDCGDKFPNTGDTDLWFPKVLLES